MLVISLEGTYELDRDGRGGTVERPCRVRRSPGGYELLATGDTGAATR